MLTASEALFITARWTHSNSDDIAAPCAPLTSTGGGGAPESFLGGIGRGPAGLGGPPRAGGGGAPAAAAVGDTAGACRDRAAGKRVWEGGGFVCTRGRAGRRRWVLMQMRSACNACR